MSWVSKQLQNGTKIPAFMAWIPSGAGPDDPALLRIPENEAAEATLQQQEQHWMLDLAPRWRSGTCIAFVMAAPVLFQRGDGGERREAIRLHLEDYDGFCVDLLMPYRVRPGGRWGGPARNRVHFSHPIAQESTPKLGGPPAPAGENLHADET